MKPSIGRIVHYTNLGDKDGKYPPEVQAAIITKIGEGDKVHLHIFYPTGQFDRAYADRAPDSVVAGSNEARGLWQWPVRVE